MLLLKSTPEILTRRPIHAVGTCLLQHSVFSAVLGSSNRSLGNLESSNADSNTSPPPD